MRFGQSCGVLNVVGFDSLGGPRMGALQPPRLQPVGIQTQALSAAPGGQTSDVQQPQGPLDTQQPDAQSSSTQLQQPESMQEQMAQMLQMQQLQQMQMMQHMQQMQMKQLKTPQGA